jgi:phage baseplate assembly protein W
MTTPALDPREARRLLGWGPATVSLAGNVEQAQDVVFAKGDLVLNSGLETLRQDLAAAMVTALGADPLNPTFGFEGFQAIAEESDKFILREKIRVAIVNMLRRDPRVDRIDQVLIGAEIEAAAAGATVSPPPCEYGLMDIQVSFRLRGRSGQFRLNIGSILGSA